MALISDHNILVIASEMLERMQMKIILQSRVDHWSLLPPLHYYCLHIHSDGMADSKYMNVPPTFKDAAFQI